MTYKGYSENVITIRKDETATAGYPVSVGDNGVNNAVANAGFIGICRSVREGFCGVQTQGYAEVPYTGTTPSYGYVKLVANGNGGVLVKTDASVPFVKVLKVDTDNKTVGFIL